METTAVLRKQWLRSKLTDEQCNNFELRDNVTVYDGICVALAEALDCPLGLPDGTASG